MVLLTSKVTRWSEVFFIPSSRFNFASLLLLQSRILHGRVVEWREVVSHNLFNFHRVCHQMLLFAYHNSVQTTRGHASTVHRCWSVAISATWQNVRHSLSHVVIEMHSKRHSNSFLCRFLLRGAVHFILQDSYCQMRNQNITKDREIQAQLVCLYQCALRRCMLRNWDTDQLCFVRSVCFLLQCQSTENVTGNAFKMSKKGTLELIARIAVSEISGSLTRPRVVLISASRRATDKSLPSNQKSKTSTNTLIERPFLPFSSATELRSSYYMFGNWWFQCW